jgi:hypothetical protein
MHSPVSLFLRLRISTASHQIISQFLPTIKAHAPQLFYFETIREAMVSGIFPELGLRRHLFMI